MIDGVYDFHMVYMNFKLSEVSDTAIIRFMLKNLSRKIQESVRWRREAFSRRRVAATWPFSPRKILQMRPSVVSFDVFDTVLVRDTAEPKGIFLRVQEILYRENPSLLEYFPDSFCSSRKSAEKQARQRLQVEEVTLKEIYQELAETHDLSETDTQYLIQLELDLERSSLHPVKTIQDLISALRQQNIRILYISDMYLPQDFLEDTLRRTGLFKNEDRLYLSSQTRVCKSHGRMFTHVLNQEKLQPRTWVHIGDNVESDVAVPRKMGIRAFHFAGTELDRYESLFLKSSDKKPETELNFQTIAGASRLARVSARTKIESNEYLYQLGASLAGPILFSYVLWILERARTMKIKRLYFLSRDGQILLKIAQLIVDRHNLDLELRYLYASRLTWAYASLSPDSIREIKQRFLVNYPSLTLSVAAKRLSLNPDDLTADLQKYLDRKINADSILKDDEILQLQKILEMDPYAGKILAMAEHRRERAKGYFEQEGLFDETPCAIVDMGWNGNLQRYLTQMISASGYPEKEIFGFYFAITPKGKADNDPSNRMYSYFSTEEQTKAPTDSFFDTAFEHLEIFTLGDQGTTLDYHLSNNSWGPNLKEQSNSQAISWGLLSFREGVFNSVNHLLVDDNVLTWDTRSQEHINVLKSVFSAYLFNPSASDAEAIGRVHLTCDPSETDIKEYAPRLTMIQAIKYSFTYYKLHYTLSYHFTRKRSSPLVRAIISEPSLRLASSLRRILSRAKRLVVKK